MQEVEQVILDCDTVKIYDSDIDRAIDEACQKCEIEDLCKATQRQWKAVLSLVGKSVFPDNKILKDTGIGYYSNTITSTNCNRYDYNKISQLYNYYVFLSNKYNKLISIDAFAYFINISRYIVEQWREQEPSTASYHIWQNAKKDRLDCIMDRAYDSPNVTGVMFVGNTEYGLNLPGVREQRREKRVETADEIARKYGYVDAIEAQKD